MASESGVAKIEELVSDGKIPSVLSLNNDLNYTEMIIQDENGNYVMSPIFYHDGNLYKVSDPLKDSKYNSFTRVGAGEGDPSVKMANSNSESTTKAVDLLGTLEDSEIPGIIEKYGSMANYISEYWQMASYRNMSDYSIRAELRE